MVDRLFWRAGFGPSAADRANWTGKLVTEAVDALLGTSEGPLVGPEPTREGKPLDPFGDQGGDTDLVLQWVDRMIRTPTPFIERMTFFWHRLWANSRLEVSPPQLLVQQNAPVPRLRRLRQAPRRRLRRHGPGRDDEPVDAALPQRRDERQAAARTRTTPAS